MTLVEQLRFMARGAWSQRERDILLVVADRLERSEQRINELEQTLWEIRRDIEECADDVVWMRGGIETVVDRINAVIGATSELHSDKAATPESQNRSWMKKHRWDHPIEDDDL